MATYKIVTDTSCDIPRQEAEDMGLGYVPFKINIEGVEYVDDYKFDKGLFIAEMKASKNPIRTACPAPAEYEKALVEAGEADGIFVVTISSKLSGSHAAAAIGIEDYKKNHPHTEVALIDSKSASAGHANVVYQLQDMIDGGLDFDGVTKKIRDFVDGMETMFILESMDNLIKNGRIRKTAGLVISKLNVKPIMEADDGEIVLHHAHRGFKRSLRKMADYIIKKLDKEDDRLLTVSYVDDESKASLFKDWVQEKLPKLDIKILATKGLASGYADRGGIVIGF